VLRHFLGMLLKENLLGFLLVSATTLSLAIQAYSQTPFEWIWLLPIGFTVTYLVVHLRNVTRLARQTFHAVPVPYSVCLGQTHDWFEAALRQQEQKLVSLGLAWSDIQRTYRLHRMDWAFFDEHRLGLQSRAWVEKAREVCRHFDHLTNRIPIQPVYHVFLAVPGTLALALGAKFGRRIPAVVYQHAGMVQELRNALAHRAELDDLDERLHDFVRTPLEGRDEPVAIEDLRRDLSGMCSYLDGFMDAWIEDVRR